MDAVQSERLLARVDTLPTLPAVATRLLEVTLSEASSASEIGKTLLRDPALTAKVLQVVNSAAYGLRYPVSDVSYAITVLGLQKIRTLVLSLSIFEALSGVQTKGSLDQFLFWRHSVATASAAKALAQRTGRGNPEEAYVTGLIHDLGMLVLNAFAPELYEKVIRQASREGGDALIRLERESFGTTHAEVGAQLAGRWKLPPALREAILHHHSPEETTEPFDSAAQRLVALTACADHVAWSAGYPSLETSIPPVPRLAVIELLSDLDLPALFDAVHDEVKQGTEIFRYSDPSGERWQRALLRANVELGRIATRLDLANRGLSSLNAALLNTQHRLGEHDPVESLLAEVLGTLGYDRAFLIAPETKDRCRVLRVMSNDGGGAEWEGIELPLPEPLRAPNAAGVRLRRSGEAGEGLLRKLRSPEMVLAPIRAGSSVQYFLAADRAVSKQEIGPGAEETISCLTAQAGLLLENYRLYQTVQHMAVTDPLTGVCNRRRLMEVLSEEAERAARTRQPFSVAILDLDHFKTLNDKLGHLTGDQTLKKMGELLRNIIRQGDLVGRYGGEEFLVVLPGADIEKAKTAAERMRKAIEQFGKGASEMLRGHALTASIGIAELDPDRENFEGLLGRADEAMYRAKEAGRNQVLAAAPSAAEGRDGS